MARIITQETGLTRRRAELERESRRLRTVVRIERTVAALFSAAGLVALYFGHPPILLVIAGLAGFLALGHGLKIRENRRERENLGAGLRGEERVSRLLERALSESTCIFNDLTVRHGRRSAQIDHLVVAPNGVFILETKNWRGRLSGDERAPRWEQARDDTARPISVGNPIQQNRRHLDVLRAWLAAHGRQDIPLHTAVVMTNPNAQWSIANQTVPLVSLSDLPDYIASIPPPPGWGAEQQDALITRLAT